MSLHVFEGFGTGRAAVAPVPLYRPAMEQLEDRTVPAVGGASLAQAIQQALILSSFSQGDVSVFPLQINQVQISPAAKSITAVGTLFGQQVVIPITATIDRVTPTADNGQTCAILDLQLQPINLNLLGLNVQTSPICLEVNAVQGQLLGDLLCSVANLLDPNNTLGALNLNNRLEQLGSLRADLREQLPLLLDAAMDALSLELTNGTGFPGPTQGGLALGQPGGRLPGQGLGNRCDILNLDVGPLNLNLLGLEVNLDDCNGGPVQVDIFATRGPGQLLGNLLCGIVGALDRFPPIVIDPLFDRILDGLGDIFGPQVV